MTEPEKSLFDLAERVQESPSWASGEAAQPLPSKPSWAHQSGSHTFTSPRADETLGLKKSGGTGSATPSTSEPDWLKRSGGTSGLAADLKRSVDVLRLRKLSTDGTTGLTTSGFGSASSDDDGALLSAEKEPLPDQIGSFMRIADDEMRARGMALVVTLLLNKIEARDEPYLAKCVAIVQRLALESAFASVRAAFGDVLERVRAAEFASVPVPPVDPVTRWIAPDQLPSIVATTSGDDKDDEGGHGRSGTAADTLVSRLLRSINVMEGRVPRIVVVLSWHPTFLERWYRGMIHLMRGPGPLPFTWRRFISIVACARFQCMPMVKLQEMDFLSCGGDPSWVTQGLNAADLPAKLQQLMELNAMLAHQPWRITAQRMEALLGLSVSKEATWSIGELVHAISIMVTFHSICGLVWGLGIRPELDIDQLHRQQPSAESSVNLLAISSNTTPAAAIPLDSAVANDTSRLIHLLKQPETFNQQRQNWMESESEHKASVWASTDQQSLNDLSRLRQQTGAQGGSRLHELQYCSKYIGSHVMEHSDFDTTHGEYTIFYKAQYSWGNDGYPLVNQVLEGLAPLLDAELKHIRSLTYHRFADKETNIDTSAFREAIWHYTHRIKGLLDDDYNYAEVNQLLNRQIKYYVKKITCFPQTVNMTDFANLGYDLQQSEKVHIALLATEACKEAALSYSLRALTDWQRKK